MKFHHALCCVLTLCLTAAPLQAGGISEHALLIVDPTDPASLYLANHYRSTRQIPDQNIVYLFPTNNSYNDFIDDQLAVVFGKLATSQIEDHIDYIVMAPHERFAVPVGNNNLINDTCSPVTRFSLTGAFTMAKIASEVQGGLQVLESNRFFRATLAPRGFSSQTAWLNGMPSTDPDARRYFIGAQLGCTNVRGNTVSELFDLITRSAAVDGTFPTGTFYYCETSDAARSGPRDSTYSDRVNNIIADGGSASLLMANLPTSTTDAMGVMTGLANPPFSTANMTMVDGAIGDHLTSFAGTFDNGLQTKMSEWVRVNASGSWGTVEEPCNYSQKFPDPRLHVIYHRGSTLGAALFRSIRAVPFQGMLYGDPLTRPFAFIPVVGATGLPGGTASGTFVLTPSATTPDPDAAIADLRLLIDGVVVETIAPGGTFSVDTTTLSDGWHDLRILATDNSVSAVTGRWRDSIVVDNNGQSVTGTPTPTSGDHSTLFAFNVTTTGSDIDEIRLSHNGRVVAATSGSSGTLSVTGLTLGAGQVEVHAEALLTDGSIVRSAPIALDISFSSGTPSGNPPRASSYTRSVLVDQVTLLEFAGGHDNDGEALTFVVTANPSQATVDGASVFNYRYLRPNPDASGTDTLSYRIDSPSGSSTVETITIRYGGCFGDLNGDGVINLSDLALVLGNFGSTGTDGDSDGDGDVDLTDLANILALFGSSCP